MVIWLAAVAHAGSLVVGAAGGIDAPVRHPWAGLGAALVPDGTAGVEPIGRLDLGWSPQADRGPYAATELGATVVLPEDEAVLRVGLLARATFGSHLYAWPVDVAEPDDRHLGIAPAGLALVELQYGEDAPHWIGFQGGAGSYRVAVPCGRDATRECDAWHPGFVGGFYVRKHFASGLALEARAGTLTAARVGWAW